MCVYKFTLSNGFYYFGATSNLGERIYSHLKNFRNNNFPEKFMEVFNKSNSIKFEVIRFVNDRSKLNYEEEKYLSRHIGLPKCLNTILNCTSGFKRGKGVFRIAKTDFDGNIIKIYETPSLAARDLNINRRKVEIATKVKYPRTDYALRTLSKSGEIISPAKPYREYIVLRKPVKQYDKENNFISSFESVGDAARILKLDRKGISHTANSRQKSCGGFVFRFD